jgi:hypothetical protein
LPMNPTSLVMASRELAGLNRHFPDAPPMRLEREYQEAAAHESSPAILR